MARAIDSLPEEARALEGIGHCRLRDGHAAEAATALRQALAIYERIGSPHTDRLRTVIREHSLQIQSECPEPSPGGSDIRLGAVMTSGAFMESLTELRARAGTAALVLLAVVLDRCAR